MDKTQVPAADNEARAVKWRRFARWVFLGSCYRTGLCALFDRLNRDAARVLTYHGICEARTTATTGMDIDLPTFEHHVAWLAARYHLVAADDAGRRPGSVALSFDDGLASDYHRAAPVLERHGARGTFFVCSDIAAGQIPATWHDIAYLVTLLRETDGGTEPETARSRAMAVAQRLERDVRTGHVQDPYIALVDNFGDDVYTVYEVAAQRFDPIRFSGMQASELCDLIDRGHRVGSHSRRHLILRLLGATSADAMLHDLKLSRKMLSNLIGSEVDILAYPYGGEAEVGARVEAAAERAGYRRAYYNGVPTVSTHHRMARLQAPTADSRVELFAVTSGLLHFLKTGRLLPRRDSTVEGRDAFETGGNAPRTAS